MTAEEYEAKVAASTIVGGYASSSARWRDHLFVYPDSDGSTIDNVRRFEREAAEVEVKMAEINRQLAEPEAQDFLDFVALMAGYWAGEGQSNVPESMSVLERCEGVAFSILAAIDGGSAVGPYSLRPVEDDGRLGPQLSGDLHSRLAMSKPGS